MEYYKGVPPMIWERILLRELNSGCQNKSKLMTTKNKTSRELQEAMILYITCTGQMNSSYQWLLVLCSNWKRMKTQKHLVHHQQLFLNFQPKRMVILLSKDLSMIIFITLRHAMDLNLAKLPNFRHKLRRVLSI